MPVPPTTVPSLCPLGIHTPRGRFKCLSLLLDTKVLRSQAGSLLHWHFGLCGWGWWGVLVWQVVWGC